FTQARAYGLEARVDLPPLAPYGLTGYFNYALSRGYFYNPVTGGFVTEPEHLDSSGSTSGLARLPETQPHRRRQRTEAHFRERVQLDGIFHSRFEERGAPSSADAGRRGDGTKLGPVWRAGLPLECR